LLLLAAAGLYRRRWNLAAACAAGAALLKIYPIVFGMLACLNYPKKFLPRFLLALLMGAAIPLVFWRWGYVWDEHHRWIRFVSRANRQLPDLGKWFQDLRLVARVWFVPLSPRVYAAIQLVVGGAIALLCRAGRMRGVPRRRLIGLTLGLSCCWMTVFGSAAELSTYILVAPPLAWAFVEAWLSRHDVAGRALVTGAYALTLITQIAMWFPAGKRFATYGTQVFAGLLLFAYLVLALARELRRAGRGMGLREVANLHEPLVHLSDHALHG
jgi:hypothetical protein